MQSYDVVVIGCGGIGSAALHHLARQGVRTLGIEQFGVAHQRGSSHGQTRIIRQAYFEHPDYVPLLRDTYRHWQQLEEESSQNLFYRVGLLEVGPADGALIPGIQASAQQHGLAIETFPGAEVSRRFRGFQAEDDTVAVFERNAGYLMVEDAVRAQLDCARACGAELRTEQAVREWRVEGDSVCVECEKESFSAARLVLTTGAWACPLLLSLGVDLQVVPKHIHWYANQSSAYREGSPVFFYETQQGYFYGFPQIDAQGVKIAEHSGGHPVSDPMTINRKVDPQDRARTIDFLHSYLPELSDRPLDHKVCFYTMSPDGHFIVDRHPVHQRVVFAAGLSGHGFKFAPVLGQALAELALQGVTDLPVGFLSLKRFAGNAPAGALD